MKKIVFVIFLFLVCIVSVVFLKKESLFPSTVRSGESTQRIQQEVRSPSHASDTVLTEVTSQMHNKSLPQEVRSRFHELLKDIKQPPLIRNNAANALVGQDKKDPELWRLFLKMAQDPKEDEVWRDYCLQFLGACVPFASEAQTVTDYLATVAREEGIDRAGTAAIMLRRLTDDGLYIPPANVIDTLIQQTKNEKIPPAARMSMLALVGRDGSATHAAFLREVIATTKDDDFLRVAIAGLGQIGNTSDLPLVNAGLKHPNKSVVLAAQGAQRRLAKRFPISASSASVTSVPPP